MLYKKTLALFLVITMMLLSSSNSIFATSNFEPNTLEKDTPNQKEDIDNIYNKIHVYLNVPNPEDYHTIDSESELDFALSDLYNSDKQTNTKISTENNLHITIEYYSGFAETEEFKSFSSERNEIHSIDEMRDFRSRLNNFSKQYHAKVLNSYLPTLSSLEYDHIDLVGYSPYIVLDMKSEAIRKDDLINLASYDDVLNIYVEEKKTNSIYTTEDEEYSPQTVNSSQGTIMASTWNDMLRHIGAYDVVQSETYTGEGIRIGVLEAVEENIYDINNSNFSDKDITILTPSNTSHGHATAVLSVVTLIAPNAEYYFANCSTTGFELFIDAGCDIVNMSFGSRVYGYTSAAGIIDYHAYHHYITSVVSAGNISSDENDPRIVSPGYGFNTITVGGVVETSLDYIIHCPTSRYVSDYPIIKPNITAIHKVYIPNCDSTGTTGTATSGTSIAAPQVTGCIALMAEYMYKERNYQIVLFPESIMAILSATASKTHDYTCDYEYFDDKVGAGIINLERMISNETLVTDHTFNNAQDGMKYTPTTICLYPGQELQLSLALLTTVASTGSVNSVAFTDYDILIYPLSGSTALASSVFAYDSNVELIRYTATSFETIRIVIRANEDCVHSDGKDDVAWSYSINE